MGRSEKCSLVEMVPFLFCSAWKGFKARPLSFSPLSDEMKGLGTAWNKHKTASSS